MNTIYRLKMNEKILIVEDSLTLRETIKGYIDHLYDVSHATNGQDAITLLAEKPDLILLDLNLPDTHGLKMIEQMKETGAKVIVLTGETKSESVASALRSGADDYLAKPVCATRLKLSIAKVLEK